VPRVNNHLDGCGCGYFSPLPGVRKRRRVRPRDGVKGPLSLIGRWESALVRWPTGNSRWMGTPSNDANRVRLVTHAR
jgi:hypothetical protein